MMSTHSTGVHWKYDLRGGYTKDPLRLQNEWASLGYHYSNLTT